MATVILSVSDPLGLKADDPASPLIIDDYVFVEIAGRELSGVIELPRSSLQDGDTVWVCNDNTLDIRPVTLAWKNTDNVYIKSGLSPGNQIVTSEIASPVQGMALRIIDARQNDDNSRKAEMKASI